VKLYTQYLKNNQVDLVAGDDAVADILNWKGYYLGKGR
jgi:hypothetical protein